jgi:hypothetical protein
MIKEKDMNKTMISLMGFDASANIAAANARADMFKSNADTVREVAATMRKVTAERCESYKKLVIDTYLDCEYKKVKISKRVAKVPKYARGITK